MPDTKTEKRNGQDVHIFGWANYTKQIKRIIISEGITSIGKENFYNFYKNLETVILPNTLKVIGKDAFFMNKRLKEINLPNSLTTIKSHAFTGCNGLKKLIIPDSVTQMGEGAFDFCENLSTVKLSKNLKVLPYGAFSECYKLTKVEIPSGVTKIGRTAFWCCSLKSIDLPASVTEISAGTFEGCSKLTSIKIRNKKCKIVNPRNKEYHTIPKSTAIYSYRGSTAEKYAKKHGNRFKLLKEADSKKIKVKKIRIKNTPKFLKAGKSRTLKAAISPQNATNKKLSWKSGNKKYATINSRGKVTAKRAGKGKTVKITATARDGSGKKVSVKIKIQ